MSDPLRSSIESLPAVPFSASLWAKVLPPSPTDETEDAVERKVAWSRAAKARPPTHSSYSRPVAAVIAVTASATLLLPLVSD